MINTRSSLQRRIAFSVALLSASTASKIPAAAIRALLRSPAARTAARPFRLTDASGKTQTLSDYRGKVVVLNFWATECGGCRLELPSFVELEKSFDKARVAVVGVSMDVSYEDLKSESEAWAKVRPFAKEHQLVYPMLMGNTEVEKQYDITALPATYLIDTHGRIAAVYVGVIDEPNVKTNIEALLAEKQ